MSATGVSPWEIKTCGCKGLPAGKDACNRAVTILENRGVDPDVVVAVADFLGESGSRKNVFMRKQRTATWVFAISLVFSITLHGFLVNCEVYVPACHDRSREILLISLSPLTETPPSFPADEKNIGSKGDEKAVASGSFARAAGSERKIVPGSVAVITPRSLKRSLPKTIASDMPGVAEGLTLSANPAVAAGPLHAKSDQQLAEGAGSGPATGTEAIKSGGAMVRPMIKNFERPRYPSLARRHGHEGTVVLEMEILADGSVGKVAITGSSRYPELDRAAQQALENASCIPASLDGMPVRSLLKKEITFRLTD